MELLWIASTFGMAFWIYKLQERVKHLEDPLENSFSTPVPQTKVKEINQEEDDGVDRSKWPSHLQQTVSKSAAIKSKTVEKALPFDLENFLGQKLFPILGATSIVVAIGFFAVWAFSNGWIGPMGRIALGILVSLSLIGLGEYLKNKYPDFFCYLVAAGLAGLIVTTLLAHYVYDFISATQSLVMLALQAGVGVMLALRYNSRILANFSIAAGLLAPWFSGQLEPMLVLPFVLVLAVAGFVLALNKKWPEIFVSLIVFSSSYIFAALEQLGRELLDHNYNLNKLEVVSSINPIQLLLFAFIIYALIGSAGVVRLILNYKSSEPPKEEVHEIVLFTIALLLFNLCASGAFYAQSWEHIGFLVGAQALGLLALADWFKSKNWSVFHLITLSSSLLFVVIATAWELRNYSSLILTLTLIFDGVFMCGVGQLSKQKIYEWFGRGTLILALLYSLANNISEFALEAVLTCTFVTAFVYSIGNVKQVAEKIWLGFSIFLSTVLLFGFSFEANEIPDSLKSLLPALWTLGLLYFAYQQKSFFMRVSTLLVYAIFSLVVINQFVANDYLFVATWLPIALIGSLYYYVSLSFKETSKADEVMAYGSILILSISWIYQTGQSFAEPLLTVCWLALIGILMTLGLMYKPLKELRYIGLGITLFIIAKLYLVDIWQWDIPVRVMAFTALGVALLSIGFFYQKTWLKK